MLQCDDASRTPARGVADGNAASWQAKGRGRPPASLPVLPTPAEESTTEDLGSNDEPAEPDAPWDRRNLATKKSDDGREQERNFWRHAGVVLMAARLGAFVQHEAREDGRSVFSDGWYHLRAPDWYSCEVQDRPEPRWL